MSCPEQPTSSSPMSLMLTSSLLASRSPTSLTPSSPKLLRVSQSVTGANLTDKIHDYCAVLLATSGQSNPLQQANVANTTKSKYPPGSCDRCGRNDCVPGGCCRNTDIHGNQLDKSTKTALGRKIGREQYNNRTKTNPILAKLTSPRRLRPRPSVTWPMRNRKVRLMSLCTLCWVKLRDGINTLPLMFACFVTCFIMLRIVHL